MDWQNFPWSAIVTGLLAVIGFIGWLVRLEGKASQVEKDLARESKDNDDRFNAVSGTITLVQGDVRELQIKSITREDLKEVQNDIKEVKTDLTASIREVGDRTDAAVERLITVFNKKPATRAPAKPRS